MTNILTSRYHLILVTLLLKASSTYCAEFIVDQTPYAVAYTPNSVLINPPEVQYLRYAGDKPRYSTCTGVCWFQGIRFLFAINLHTSSIQVYEFFPEEKSLLPVKRFDNADGLDLKRPDNISISNDGLHIAVPNMSHGKVQVYRTDESAFINPKPCLTIQSHQVHGTRFSPDSKYLAYVCIGEHAQICVTQITKKKKRSLTHKPLQTFYNPFEPMRPKSIDFSNDGRFVAIGFCIQVTDKIGQAQGVIATYHFDDQTGRIDPTPISCVEGLQSVETVAFNPDSSCIFAVDQVNDLITAHDFDRETGKIESSWIALQGQVANLQFPHGVSFSPDGKYVAVSNYGDDKVSVYTLSPNNSYP